MFDLATVQEAARDHDLVRNIDALRDGLVRIETAFLYPDGSAVDVFVPQEPGALFSEQLLSDLGQTTAWLLDVQVRPWQSKKRQRFLEDAIRIHGVRQNGGALEKPIAGARELVPGILALGQACMRVADLTYTRRASQQTAFGEELEEFISDLDLPYESNVDLEGKWGVPVRVEHVVSGNHSKSAVLSWSTPNPSSAHTVSNEIFRKWYDLASNPNRHEQRITVLDDRFDSYRSEDIERVREYSDVMSFSQKESLREALEAA